MPIDYGRLISRTWEIFSRNRVLWILALIASLTGGGSSGSSFNYSQRSSVSPQFDYSSFMSRWGGLIFGLACFVFILAIVLSFVHAIAEAALISTVDQIENTHEEPKFAAAWGLGRPKMLPVWGLNLVVGLITAIVIIIAVLPFIFAFASFFASLFAGIYGDQSTSQATGGTFILGCLCGCLLLIVAIPLSIALNLTRELAVRGIVLENQGVFEALGNGWRLMRANLGATIVLFLITIVVGIIVGIPLFGISLVLLVPLLAATGLGGGDFSLPAVLILGLLLVVLTGIVATASLGFDSVMWTLFYRNRRQMPNSDLSPLGMMPPVTPGGPTYGNPYGTGYGAPPSYPSPTYPPPSPGAPPPYTPPAGPPPSYTPPAGPPPPYTPPDAGMGFTPPAPPNTIQYGSPYGPPPAPPPAGGATQAMGPLPPDSGSPAPPDDRARGPEGTTGGQ